MVEGYQHPKFFIGGVHRPAAETGEALVTQPLAFKQANSAGDMGSQY